MGVLKFFMILGAICFMYISMANTEDESIFLRNTVGMLVCSIIAISINNFC